MNIQLEKRGEVDIVRPVGRLDSVTSEVFTRAVAEVFDRGSRLMVLDFSLIEYVSSAGLRSTLLAGKRMRSVPGGKLALCAFAPGVREIFEISGFLAIFTVGTDLEAALALLGAGAPAAG